MSQFTHVKKWFEEVYKTIGKFRLSQIQTTVLAALPKKALKKSLDILYIILNCWEMVVRKPVVESSFSLLDYSVSWPGSVGMTNSCHLNNLGPQSDLLSSPGQIITHNNKKTNAITSIKCKYQPTNTSQKNSNQPRPHPQHTGSY